MIEQMDNVQPIMIYSTVDGVSRPSAGTPVARVISTEAVYIHVAEL
jgi:hypothetical protein